ncbi:MAG: hypothetical protein E6J43_04475 [Chloroflexi bacterium]|nr:MAG: hypothetical protein E6J43_04475 [Chloroflexota bacterium]
MAGGTVSGEGSGQSLTNTGTCIDNAGNAASSATVGGINIDKTSPAISGSRDPAANASGWNNGDVAVSFSCADTGAVRSGIATDTVAGGTVSGEGSGQSLTNTGTCIDNAANAASPSTVDGINIDKTSPAISGSRSPLANGHGWNNTSVSVSFNCADNGLAKSGIATDTLVGATLTGEGAGQSVTSSGNCIDNAGNAAFPATVGGINIDKTPPLISGSRSPKANSNGWNNTDVVVTFGCADAGSVQSGIAAATVVGATISGEGAGQSLTNSGDCTDNAGNAASSATVNGINIDKTAPQIVGSRSPQANADGWNNSDVTVSFSCADAGSVQSGIATNTVAGAIVSGEGAGQSVSNSGSCVDKAGNPASPATVASINIDRTAPQITGARSPSANARGWNNSDVTVHYTCSDTLSLVGSVTADQIVSSEGAAQSRSGVCTDRAGNSAGASVLNINVDKTSPTVAVTGFSNGAMFYTGEARPTAGCATPRDSLSGVDSSTGPTVVQGGLSANGVGSLTYQCTAKDLAGNAAAATSTYSVRYGGSSGILQPINPDNTSVFKRGQAVPVKFRLGGDEPAGFATGGWVIKRIQVSCAALTDLAVIEDVGSNTPSTTFRYDSTADQYIYNADFKNVDAGSCWRITVTLDDGATTLYSAYFKISR